MIIAIVTLIAALALSVTAAFYSVIGLMTIFSGASIAVAIMAGSMEVGKIVSVVWLHRFWREKIGVVKYALSTMVLVLMIITSMGIYGFLSSAYLQGNVGINASTTRRYQYAYWC